MKQLLFSIVFILGLSSGPASAGGGIYKWVDDNGNVHFSDKPPSGGKASEVEVRINSYTSPQITASPFSGQAGNAASHQQVVLYSTRWCGYCKKARNYFQKNNIAFTEYDVETTEKGKRDYRALGGSSVPIILVGDKRLNGFSAAAFERIY